MYAGGIWWLVERHYPISPLGRTAAAAATPTQASSDTVMDDDIRDAANHAGIGKVKIANSTGFALVEFDYDFSNALDLGSINITLGNESGFGSMIINGINLSGQNITKQPTLKECLHLTIYV